MTPAVTPERTAQSIQETTASSEAWLRRLYDAYCRRQAAALLSLVPRDGIRPLYRKARESCEISGIQRGEDPIEILNRFCREILPLPPFAVWAADFAMYPAGHLDAMRADPALNASAPVTVELRTLRHAATDWLAELNLFPDGEVWRGFIEFRGEGGATGARTADIFRDPDPMEIRQRFRSFEPATLQAFLRSTLP